MLFPQTLVERAHVTERILRAAEQSSQEDSVKIAKMETEIARMKREKLRETTARRGRANSHLMIW